MRSPVSSIRLAFSTPNLATHMAVVGVPHTLAGGYPMRAVSSITRKSAHRAMSVPPATQKPWTLTTTGLSEWNSDMNPLTLRDIICQSITGSHVWPGSWLWACVRGLSGPSVCTVDNTFNRQQTGSCCSRTIGGQLGCVVHHMLGTGHQVVPATKALALAAEPDDVDQRVQVGLLHGLGQFPVAGVQRTL